MRDLVNNSSGVPRYDIPLLLEELTPEEAIAWLADIPLVAQPGEEFHYSNLMVATGGWAAAVAAGAEDGEDIDPVYRRLMQERVFDPIGMTSTTFDFDAATASDNHAFPYIFRTRSLSYEPLRLDYERFALQVAPAGAAWSNVEDMARYMATQLDQGNTPDGQRVVSSAGLRETQMIHINISATSGYGMGWFIDDYKGLQQISHVGNTGGFSSDFGFLPDAGIGVVVLSNRSVANNFGASVREYVYEMAFDLEHRADEFYQAAENALNSLFIQLAPGEGQEISESEAAPYLGQYEHGVTISYDPAGRLIVETEMITAPLLWQGGGSFVGLDDADGTQITFLENDDGYMTATLASTLNAAPGEEEPTLILLKLDQAQ